MTMMITGLQEMAKLIGNGLGGATFDSVALGSGTTAVANTQTALVTELTTNGAARQTGANVTGSLATNVFANDTARFLSIFTLTGSVNISEVGVFNNNNVMLLRQVYAAPIPGVATDVIQLQIDVIGSDDVVGTTNLIHQIGIAQQNRSILTDATGGTRLTANALGTGTTALSATATTLATEITATATGLTRAQGTHSVTLDTENVANDTVNVTSFWTCAQATSVTEQGAHDSAATSGGNCWHRYLYAAPVPLVVSDIYYAIERYVNK